ncbi:DegV family protein [Fictibacillus gelatini]|uniref:DegV family protein n=1 Tax=Fictibacillus gelatini TaxID=225985 RepID=UPI000415CE2B|nr:DegV family protein [Fictibacillus gelatini]
MTKTAIITDSTSYIPESIRKQLNIFMIPLTVTIGEETYKEEVELTKDEFYKKIGKEGALPKSSQPPIGELVQLLEELAKDYDEAVMITLSSGISGTYQSAVSATNMVDTIKLHVFDSEISCAPQGFYVLKAAEMAKNGATAEAIMDELQAMKERGVYGYFVVEDLNHLHRGGRLNAAQLLVGNLLQIKPVLVFKDKKIVPFEKIRTKKKAIKRILDIVGSTVTHEDEFTISIVQAERENEAREIAEGIQEKYPKAQLSIDYFGPVIATHVGEGTIGICWYKHH